MEHEGETELGLLPPSTAIISSSCRHRAVPAREEERGNNRKITLFFLPQILQLERGERETTAQNRNLFLGQARNICKRPSQPNHSPQLQHRHFCSPGAVSPCWALSLGRRCSPKVLLPWELPTPPAPTPKANPMPAVVDQAAWGWDTGFPTP